VPDRSLTRDEASAEDLAQDALVEALARPPATGSLRGWFATVLRTRAIDRGRAERRRAAREQRAARRHVENARSQRYTRAGVRHS
jgi:DNA-directed RNA polymerase specialized sigma24 family protein